MAHVQDTPAPAPMPASGADSWLRAGRRTLIARWMILGIIVLTAAVLRFDRLSDTTIFLGDQARDVARVQKMIEDRYPAVVGSGSSLGTYQRGPAYYYLLLLPVWLSGGHPASPAVFVALVDLGTIVLLFIVGKTLFSPWVGQAAAGLWSCAGLIVTLARWSWNPNPLPFFVLLIVFALYKIAAGDGRYVMVAVPAWSIALQLHEQSLLMLPFFGCFVAWFRPRIALRYGIAACALGVAVASPYLLYELLRGFRNTRAMLRVILLGDGGPAPGSALGQMVPRLGKAVNMLTGHVIPGRGVAHKALEAALVVGAAWLPLSVKVGCYRPESVCLFLLWLTVPLMYGFWPGKFHPHYLVILFPLAFLLVGLCVDMLRRLWLPVGVLAAAALALFIAISAGERFTQTHALPLQPGSLGATRAAVDHVLKESRGEPFGFRLVSAFQGSEAFEVPYTYLFHWYGREPSVGNDLQTFIVYDPANAGTEARSDGVVINGVRIVHEGRRP